MTYDQALEKVKDVCYTWPNCANPCNDRCWIFRRLLTFEYAKRGFKRYTNGYEAWWIELHPREKVLRDINQPVHAFPEEKIVLMHDTSINSVPVVFLKTIDELYSIEDQMNLKAKDIYFYDTDKTITYVEDKL